MTVYKTNQSKFNYKKFLKIAIVILLVMAVFALCYYGAMKIFLKQDAKNMAQSTIVGGKNIIEKKVSALKYVKDCKIGDSINELNTMPADMMESDVPVNVVHTVLELKNKRLKRNVFKNEFVLLDDLIDVTLWYEESDRLVEHSFAEGTVPAFVKEGSLIDIKQFRVADVDPFVIAKAVVISREGNKLSMLLNDIEQEYLKESAAEGNLFIVQYGDSYQEASTVTYEPVYVDKLMAPEKSE